MSCSRHRHSSGDPGDWLRRAIETALETRRNIVPLLLEGSDFTTPSIASQLTGKLAALKHYNAMRVPAEYFDEAMDRLRERYLNVPIAALLLPTSMAARQAADAQRAVAGTVPALRREEQSAQEWFEKGFNAAKLDEKIQCYSRAIRLKPDLAEAYNHRGNALRDKGDLDGAFKDYAEAIILKRVEVRSLAIAAKLPFPPLLMFEDSTSSRPTVRDEYCVSYAWGDNTPEGRERELIVDQLCAAAEERGITIVRDKKVLGIRDRISKFMQRIGRGDRVFVVLSDKYLKSPYCMYELYELWRNCRQDDEEFLSNVRVYTLPDAKIWTPLDRAERAEYWENEYAKLEPKLKHLGRSDFDRYLCMKAIHDQVSEILATVTDILQPRDFEQLKNYGFDDPPEKAPPT